MSRPRPAALGLLADLQSAAACIDPPPPPMNPAETCAWLGAEYGAEQAETPELTAAWYAELEAAGHVVKDADGRFRLARPVTP